MAYDFPAPPAHIDVVTNADRGYSIVFPALGTMRAARAADRAAEDALLRKLGGYISDAKADYALTAVDIAPVDLATDVVVATDSQPHPAARLALIMGASAALWAAIGYGVVSVL